MSGTEDRPENYQDITYALNEQGGKTTLNITQDNIKNEDAKKHSEENWQGVFGKMKEMVENGEV